MRFHWGTGIALVYSTFVLTILAVVLRSRAHDPVLVRQDYYQLDLDYQAHLEKRQHAAALSEPVAARYEPDKGALVLQFPREAGRPSGRVKYYRPTTTRDDGWLDIRTDRQGRMEIPAKHWATGRWRVEVDWKGEDGTAYFHELVVVR